MTRDELADEEETEVAALPQRGGVHQDPARHGRQPTVGARTGPARRRRDQESCWPRSRTEMSQAAGQSFVRSSASLPPSQKTHRPAEERAVGAEQEVDQRGDLLGPAGPPERDRQHVEQRAGFGVGPHARHHRRVDHAGGDGVEPEARAGPVASRGVPAHPVGQRQLGGRVGHQGVTGVGDPRAQLLVVAEEGLDQVGRDGRLHRGRVRADRHGGTARAPAAAADPRARPPCRSSSRRPAASRPGPAGRPTRRRSRCRPARRRSVPSPRRRRPGAPRGSTGRRRCRSRPCRCR